MERARGLNAFIVETPEKARAMADASDIRRKQGKVGAMEGIPLGIKDLFCTEGVQTTAGSPILEGFTLTYESPVTTNLWKAGAGILGKLYKQQLAMGPSNTTRNFGKLGNSLRHNNRAQPI